MSSAFGGPGVRGPWSSALSQSRGSSVLPQSGSDAEWSGRTHEMWKLSRGRVLLDEPPEEEDGLRGAQPASAAAPAPGASLRGWKEVTSLFNKDDEQHLIQTSKSPKSKGSNLRLKEELKAEKKSGFWDTLVLKQNTQPKKPDQIEGWEPPKLTAEDVAADIEDGSSSCPSWSGWEDDTKGSTKYTSLANSASGSRWSLRSAGKLVSIRRQSKGHLTDTCEEVE
ncbi:testis development-related protein isoform X2 [Chionomys nivalis]|uniref:testis development-related protein isoform X2 n=1 Tax=Chionomys nivalis TaxID=269649 RepID=UPI00259806C1|nr:testis development-related protein isoform X2 [Chionomys nivalis]